MLTDTCQTDTDFYLTLAEQAPLGASFAPDLVRLVFLIGAAVTCRETDGARCDRILSEASTLLRPEVDGIRRLTRGDLGRPGRRDALLRLLNLVAATLHTLPLPKEPDAPVSDAARRYAIHALDACIWYAKTHGRSGAGAGEMLHGRLDSYRIAFCIEAGFAESADPEPEGRERTVRRALVTWSKGRGRDRPT